MTWSLVGTPTTSTAVASGAVVGTEPAGVAQNDLLFAWINARGTVNFTTPSGWTLIGAQFTGDVLATGGTAGISAYYCIRGASAPALSWARTAGDLGQVRITAFRSTNGAPTFDVGNVAQTSGQVTAAAVSSIAGITPTANGDLLAIGFSGADNGTVSALSTANIAAVNWTDLGTSAGTNTGADGVIHGAYYVQPTAAATGNAQGTLSIAGRNALVIAAFKEATVVPVGTGALVAASAVVVAAGTSRSVGRGDTPDLNLDLRTALDLRITFSRASNGMYYGADGVLRNAPQNLAWRSQELELWSAATGVTVTANQIAAPDGTLTADLVTVPTSSNDVGVILDITNPANVYTHSIYAKKGVSDWIYLRTQDSVPNYAWVWFNLATGTVGSKDAAYSAATIQAVGNGWYRLTATRSYTPFAFVVGIADSDSNHSVTAGKSAYFWGAQVEVGSVATSYILTLAGSAYGPRFDYDPVTLVPRGLLIERQSTNLTRYSEDFTNATYWAINDASITANSTTAPDGKLTADLLTATATPAPQVYQTNTIAAATQGVCSIYVKKGTSTFAWLRSQDNANNTYWAFLNLDTGELTTNNANGIGVSARAEAVGNGWWRISCRAILAAGNWIIVIGMSDSKDLPTSTIGKTLYIWGAQQETGVYFATSYIPTTTAVTRANDKVSMLGANFSSWYNQAQSTFVVDADSFNRQGGTYIDVDDGAPWTSGPTTHELMIYNRDTTGELEIWGLIAGVDITATSFGPFPPSGEQFRVGMAYAASDYVASLRGLAPVAIPTPPASTPVVAALRIGDWASQDAAIDGHVRRVIYYRHRASNAALQALTGPPGVITGGLVAITAALSGTGFVGVVATATGALVAQTAAVAGSGISRSLITDSSIDAQAAVLAGTGSVATAVSAGTGALTAQAAVVAGAGVGRSVASGTLAAQAAVLTSAGIVRFVGTGALSAPAAIVVSTTGISRSVSTAGALAAQAALVSGAGAGVARIGSGAINVVPAVVTGSGLVRAIGTGALVDARATIAALASTRSIATGALIVGQSTLAGIGKAGAGGAWVKAGGVWKQSTSYVRVGGAWKQAKAFAKVGGVWKQVA